MAYNQGLSQEEKDRINKQMRDLLAQGKSKEEARAWGDAQVQASLAAGKTNPSAGTDAPAVDGGSASGAGSSVSLSQFAQTAGKKKPRTDENGEVINLAEDFGEVGVFVENLPFIGDVIDDMYGAVKQGYAQGQTVDDALGLFASGADADSEQIQKYIEAVEKMQGRPPSDEMLDFDKTFEEAGGGAWGFIKAIAKNPSVAVNTSISSIVAMLNPASAAGGGVGAAGGAAVGAGFAGVGAAPGAIGGMFAGAGGVLETGVSFTEFLQEEIKKKGLDFNEDGIAQVLEDEDAMLRVRGKAAARGGVIAIIDGLTAGVASKAAKGISANAKRAAKLKGVLGATAIEAAGGGLGETAARLVVGQELDAKEIGLEIVGELGTGATIGKAAVESQPSYEIGGQKVNRRQIEALIKDDPASLGSVKVKNDPDIKAQIDEKVSGISEINDNADIITKEESEARTASIDNIAKAKNNQSRYKKTSPEYKAYGEIVAKAKEELKTVVKEQNQNYKYLTPGQKDVIAGAQQKLNNFDNAISDIQNKYKKGEEVGVEDQQLIDQFNELKEETMVQADEARAQGVAVAQQKAAEAEVRAQEREAEQAAVAEEEAVEEEAEQLGVDPAALQAEREEAQGIIDEEATDNQKVLDNLSDTLVESGVNIVPVQGAVDSSTPDNYIPLGKNKDTYSKGDFEKTIQTLEPLALVDANRLKHEIQKEANQRGWETDVDYVQQGEGFVLQGSIKAPKRKEPVSIQVKNQEATQPTGEEYAPDQGVFEEGTPVEGEEVVQDEVVQEEERTPEDYIKDFAPEARTSALPGGEIFIPGEDAKKSGAYRAVGGLRKRGHADAKFDKIGGGFLVTPGERSKGKQVEYNIDEELNLQEIGTSDKLNSIIEDLGTPYAGELRDHIQNLWEERGYPHTLTVTPYSKPVVYNDIIAEIEELSTGEYTQSELDYFNDSDDRYDTIEYSAEETPTGQSAEIDRIKALPIEAEDGATLNDDGSVYEGGGLVVPIASKNMKASELTEEAIENFKTKYKDYMTPLSKIGLYKFPNQDQVSIDLNVIAPDSKRVEALAIGKSLGQESLFSLDTFENIKTGETGANPKTPTAAQARNIAGKLAPSRKKTGAIHGVSSAQIKKDLTTTGTRAKQATAEQLSELENPELASRYKAGLAKVDDRVKEATSDDFEISDSQMDNYKNLVSELNKQKNKSEEGSREYRSILNAIDKIKNKIKVLEESPKIQNAIQKKITPEEFDAYKNIPTAESVAGDRAATDKRNRDLNKIISSFVPVANAFASKRTRKSRDKKFTPTDENLRSNIMEQMTRAFKGEEVYGMRGEFNPQSIDEAVKQLGGIAANAAAQYYRGNETAKYGITEAPTVNSEIARAQGRVQNPDNSVEVAEAINAERQRKYDVRLQEFNEGIRDKEPKSPSKIKYTTVQDALRAKAELQDISQEQRKAYVDKGIAGPVEGTQIKKTLKDISDGKRPSISNILGLDIDNIADSIEDVTSEKDRIRSVRKNIKFNDLMNNLSDVISAITPDKTLQRKLENRVREMESLSDPSTKIKNMFSKFLIAEAEGLGKQQTPSKDSEFSVGAGKTRPTKSYLDSVVAALQKAWPNNSIYTSNKDWVQKTDQLKSEGHNVPPQLKGIMAGGEVYINPTKTTMDTPIHEFAHIWAKQLMAENPQLWVKGRELLKGSSYAKAVFDIPLYRSYLKDEPGRFWEEVMANAIGKKGAEIFDSAKKANAWDRWMKTVGEWVKNALGIKSNKPYESLTLSDWIDAGVHGVFSGEVPTAPSSSKVEYSVADDPAAQPDIAAAYLAGKAAEGKWYKAPLKWLIPPAADDYHGLVSKLKNVPGIKKVTDAFIRNHQAHIDKVTKAREQVRDITKKLGIPLDEKNVATYKGNKLTAAQAIQAHVDGFPNDFSQKPEVKEYIDAMTELGVLKPSQDKRYDLASPASDLYQYLNNDLYVESFKEFNEAKAEVFTPERMTAITAEKGAKYAKALELALQRMSSGKNSPRGGADKTTQKWNDWALGSVGTIMFLNFRSAALQMMSVANFGFDAKSPGKFIANFFNPETYAEAKKLYNSAYLKERRARAGFDVNAAEMMDAINNSKSFSDFTKKILNKGFIATSAVDSMAIAMGGAAFIKAQVDSGVSRSEAISKWKESTEEAQQSARPDRVSQWQTEGISKFILAFANTPQQYFRLAQKAARSIKEGKDVKRNLAKIGYYMAAQNMLFTMAQAASLALIGGGDDEQEVRDGLNSMSSTILRGMGLYGAVIDSAKNVIMEAVKQEGKARPDHVTTVLKATGIAPPLNRKIQDLLSIGRAHNYDAEDKWTTTAAKTVTVATNLPTDWAQKKYNAAKNLWDDQYSAYQKLLMLMGWSEWNFKDDKKSGDFDSVDFGSESFASEEFESVEF